MVLHGSLTNSSPSLAPPSLARQLANFFNSVFTLVAYLLSNGLWWPLHAFEIPYFEFWVTTTAGAKKKSSSWGQVSQQGWVGWCRQRGHCIQHHRRSAPAHQGLRDTRGYFAQPISGHMILCSYHWDNPWHIIPSGIPFYPILKLNRVLWYLWLPTLDEVTPWPTMILIYVRSLSFRISQIYLSG